MNKIKTSIMLLACALLGACSVKAQSTNQVLNLLPTTGWSAVVNDLGQTIETSTNWAAIVGGGHSITGTGKNLGFVEIGYNFNDYVGLAVGYDYLSGSGMHQFNSVKGGITLQLPMHPFGFLGSTSLTNIACTPLAFDQIATSSSGTIANLVGAGVDFDLYEFSNFKIHGGGLYEKRTGDVVWGGDYLIAYLAISRKF